MKQLPAILKPPLHPAQLRCSWLDSPIPREIATTAKAHTSWAVFRSLNPLLSGWSALESVLPQFLIFGAILDIGGTIIYSVLRIFAGRAGSILARNQTLSKRTQWVTSMLFTGLAFRLALEKR